MKANVKANLKLGRYYYMYIQCTLSLNGAQQENARFPQYLKLLR